MASSLAEAMEALRAQLADGDPSLKVVTDPSALNLPGVVLYPNLIDFDRLTDDYELTVDVVLVASSVSTRTALAQLSDMVDKLRALVAVSEFQAIAVTLVNQSPDPLPALQTTITLSVTQ